MKQPKGEASGLASEQGGAVPATKVVECEHAPVLPHLIIDPNNGSIYSPGPLLGRGGFAWCYLFTCTKTRAQYAAKIIPKNRLVKPSHRNKVMKEIGIHRLLHHKNIVKLISAFESVQHIIIVMEYCPNQSLVQVIRRRGQLPETEVRYLFSQFLEGLQYLHEEKRILHRDLKLGNVLTDEHMQVKIADFGFAVKFSPDTESTSSQSICGTPNYLAPELLRSEGNTFATEAWASGCVLYSLLVGKPPFETSSLQETYARIKINSYIIPNGVSPEATDLIRRLLSADPQCRPRVSDCLRHSFLKDEISCDSGYLTPESLLPSKDKFDFSSDRQKRRSVKDTKPKTELVSCNRNSSDEPATRMTCKASQISTASRECVSGLNQAGELFSDCPTSSSSSNSGSPLRSDKMTRVFLSPTTVNISTKLKSSRNSSVADSLCVSLHKWISTPGSSAGAPLTRMVIPAVLYCARWIDYTNRYGFATQFTDGSVSVVFNDGGRITLSAQTRVYHYLAESASNWLLFKQVSDMPEVLRVRAALLHHFCKYMEENLTAGPQDSVHAPPASKITQRGIPYILKWCRREGCIAMLISDGTFQVNFTEEHMKLVISQATGEQSFFLTVINSTRHSESYHLSDLPRLGFQRPVLHRLAKTAFFLLDRMLAD